MVNQAIQKIKSEIDKSKNNPYIQVVGEFLITHLQANPNDAEKVCSDDKTIAKSLEAMIDSAKKKRGAAGQTFGNNCVMLTPQEVFEEIILKYFGIEVKPGMEQELRNDVKENEKVIPLQPAAKKNDAEFDVNLDDLL